MLLTKRARKPVAAMLLALLLVELLTPNVAYALTSGPTAPEASSFEPVDTTDMVNLQTGDLTYNIPLIEVPGPEGGYPLALSYHAGIQPNEDASWVGLGWTLNAGSLTRNVNGYPDDWGEIHTTFHDFWSGGSTTTFSAGVNVGIAKTPLSVGFGLSFSQDTYRGFSADASFNIGYKIPVKTPYQAKVSFGFESGSPSAGVSMGMTEEMVSVSASLKTNFESLKVGMEASAGSFLGNPILGASISSGGKSFSQSVGGIISNKSSMQSEVSSSTSGFGFSIPIHSNVEVSLGYSKTRYWIDNFSNVSVCGSYRGPLFTNPGHIPQQDSYDSYSMLDDPAEKSFIEFTDAAFHQGGAFLDFDAYNVSAQGLGGAIRPYGFQSQAIGQGSYRGNGENIDYFMTKATMAPRFRFVGDFANTYRQSFGDFSNVNQDLRYVEPPYDPAPIHGIEGSILNSEMPLAGTRSIDPVLRIQPSNAAGLVRAVPTDPFPIRNPHIPGFSITNQSGVTYHFGLPAYSWDEEIYQEKIDRSGGVFFNRTKRPAPYAYTWYLTTITGPDFVDRNNDGMAGEGDWGYWVNFEYGKWSNNYVWRNPSEGYHRDEDNEFQNCSMGRKDIYYLNARRTRSHIAYFEKDIRRDGKGVSPSAFNKTVNNPYYENSGVFDVNSSQSLLLKKIYLLNIEDANAVSITSGNSNAYKPSGRSIQCNDCEIASNILDKTDVDAVGRSNLEAKAIRVIDFNYDYSLSPGTANSYEMSSTTNKFGKLTLKNLIFQGKGGASLLPPTSFEYELDATANNRQTGVAFKKATILVDANFTTSNGTFEVGDLISMEGSPNIYCGVIYKKEVLGASNFRYLLYNCEYTGPDISATVVKTKNPSYSRFNYDLWGMYKSDLKQSALSGSENMARETTPLSNKSTDAWSLRRIKSPLGSNVNLYYEGKDYSKSLYSRNYSIVIQSIQKLSGNTFKITTTGNQDLRDYFSTGQSIDALLLEQQQSVSSGGNPQPIGYTVTNTAEWSEPAVITGSVSANEITLQTGANMIKHIDDSYSTTINGTPVVIIHQAKVGNLSVSSLEGTKYGGGIKVSKLEVDNVSGTRQSTNYNFSHQGISSGVTSYEPWLLDADNVAQFGDDAKKIYRKALYKNVNNLYSIIRELPGAGVMYEYATVSTEVKNTDEASSRQSEGKVEYKFEVLKNNMIGRTILSTQNGVVSGRPVRSRNLVIRKFVSGLGNVKSVTRYDAQGKKLSEIVSHYLHDGLENLSLEDFMSQYKVRLEKYAYQGFMQERSAEAKSIGSYNFTSPEHIIRATLSAREEYPCINTGQTVYDYITNTKSSDQIIAFDFYSGDVTQSVSTDAYGNRFMTELIPAYTKYPAMGMKLGENGLKNMLSQIAGKYVYKVDANNQKIGLVGAEINTWSNKVPVFDNNENSLLQDGTVAANGNIWRPQTSYSWRPDGQTANGLTATGFPDFIWANPATSDQSWKKTSEIKQYDIYSKSLEAADFNNLFSAKRMTVNSKKIMLVGSPSKYAEIAYNGAETDQVNESGLYAIKKADGIISTGTGVAHTGKKSLKLGVAGKKGFVYTVSTDKLVPGRDYVVSVWAKQTSGTTYPNVQLYYNVNGVQKGTTTVSKVAGDWKLVSMILKGTNIPAGATLEVGCTNTHASIEAYVDDMLFRPSNATTNAYVYDDFSGEVTHVINRNNLYTKYEYDAHGRLLKTYAEKLSVGESLTSETQYNYGIQYHKNSAINRVITRNNCPGNTLPGTITIVVPEGMFTSFISKADADARAEIYAQDQANILAGCNVPATVYVRLDADNFNSTDNGCIQEEFVDYYIRFFSDAACTQPVSVTNLSVKFVLMQNTNESIPAYVNCNGVETFWGNYKIYRNDCNDGTEYWSVELRPNSFYTLVQ